MSVPTSLLLSKWAGCTRQKVLSATQAVRRPAAAQGCGVGRGAATAANNRQQCLEEEGAGDERPDLQSPFFRALCHMADGQDGTARSLAIPPSSYRIAIARCYAFTEPGDTAVGCHHILAFPSFTNRRALPCTLALNIVTGVIHSSQPCRRWVPTDSSSVTLDPRVK